MQKKTSILTPLINVLLLLPVGNQTCNDNFTLERDTTPMLTSYSHKHNAHRTVHMAVGRVNIGVVPRSVVHGRYRFDSLLAVAQ